MWLDEANEQAFTRPLPHNELVRLQRCAQEARVAADLGDKVMTWHAPHGG